jgi:hypothetical protein
MTCSNICCANQPSFRWRSHIFSSLLLWLVLYLSDSNAVGQICWGHPHRVQLTAVDSFTVLNHDRIFALNMTRIYDDKLYIFNRDSAQFDLYNLKGQRVQSIPVTERDKKEEFPRQYVIAYFVANGQIYSMNPIHLVAHTPTASCAGQWSMPFNWEKKSPPPDIVLANREKLWATNNYTATFSTQMQAQHLIFPARYFAKYKHTKRRFHPDLDNIHGDNDSLTLLPTNPQLLHLEYDPITKQYIKRNGIGQVPARYQQEAHHGRYHPVSALEISFEVDTTQQQVYVLNPMDSLIWVYGYEGKIIRQFGCQGRFITPSDTVRYLTHQDMDIQNPPKCRNGVCTFSDETRAFQTKKWIYRHLTPHYTYSHLAPKAQLFFRVYQVNPHKPDVATLDALVRKQIPFDAKKQGFQSFLQIYDLANNDRLIYDEPVPTPFKVLDVEAGGNFWAIAGKEEEIMFMRKYKLIRRK